MILGSLDSSYLWKGGGYDWGSAGMGLLGCWQCSLSLSGCWCLYMLIYKLGEGNGTPLQYSCLENPMDGGAWKTAVHGVAEGQTRLSNFTFTFHFHALEKEMATHSSVLAWRIPGTGGTWWAAIYGVAQSQTGLKWLSIYKLYTFLHVC